MPVLAPVCVSKEAATLEQGNLFSVMRDLSQHEASRTSLGLKLQSKPFYPILTVPVVSNFTQNYSMMPINRECNSFVLKAGCILRWLEAQRGHWDPTEPSSSYYLHPAGALSLVQLM